MIPTKNSNSPKINLRVLEIRRQFVNYVLNLAVLEVYLLHNNSKRNQIENISLLHFSSPIRLTQCKKSGIHL